MHSLSMFAVVLLFTATSFAEGICDRTPEIATYLSQQLQKDCSEITGSDLAKIRQIDLENTPVASIKPGDFADLVSLKYLTLPFHGNIDPDVFIDLPSLIDVSLIALDDIALPIDLFKNTPQLRSVFVEGKPSRLPETIFASLSELKHSGFYLPNLRVVPRALFHENRKLTELLLGGGFQTLPEDFFRGLTDISLVRISQSPHLTHLPENLFIDQKDLFYVDMLENPSLQPLPANLFANARISHADLDFRITSEALFKTMPKMEWLHIDTPRMDMIPADYLAPFPVLANMFFSSTGKPENDSVHPDLLKYVPKTLEAVGFRGFGMTSLPEHLFDGLFADPSVDPLIDLTENNFSDDERLRIIKSVPEYVEIYFEDTNRK